MTITYHTLKDFCTKQTTIAILVKSVDEFSVGSNWVQVTLPECPRKDMKSGEGYELCKNRCLQNSHAEADALLNANFDVGGATLFLLGHSYLCGNCIEALQRRGIKNVVVIDNLKISRNES